MNKSLEEHIDFVFSTSGLFGKHLKDYEERPSQKKMAKQIFEAYAQEKITLIEAGTGIGKSFAYLVPAMVWAKKYGEKTVISTHTIALQEQLLHKDIPFLLKVLNLQLNVVLVKGMGNYLCLRRLREWRESPSLAEEEERELHQIEQWLPSAKEGSRSEMAFSLSPQSWEKVYADSHRCIYNNCPFYKQCFFFKARKEVADADLLIVNHHLLCSDIAFRAKVEEENESTLLPEYQRLIIDEAHHLEETAIDVLSSRVDQILLFNLLHRLAQELQPPGGRLFLARSIVEKARLSPQELSSLLAKIDLDLIALKNRILEEQEASFAQLLLFCQTQLEKDIEGARDAIFLRWRLPDETSKKEAWINNVLEFFQKLSSSLKELIYLLGSIHNTLESLEEPLKEKLQNPLIELSALRKRCENFGQDLELFFQDGEELLRSRWVENGKVGTISPLSLIEVRLDVSAYLQKWVFNRLKTISLCSATLATKDGFSFIRERLGIQEAQKPKIEGVYDSPFDYKKHTLLLVPDDLPYPNEPNFIPLVSEYIAQAIKASKGGAFVLFTSHEMLKVAYEYLSRSLHYTPFTLFKQGDYPRHLLVEKFKAQEGSVLLGADSFWEGVDIPGDALRCVILVRLPFKSPGDPILQLQAEQIVQKGGDPFFEYSIPQAVIKFKQGFGRLMRKKTDRGCILCLDKRLTHKSYGKMFLSSLPPTPLFSADRASLLEKMEEFYRQGTQNP